MNASLGGTVADAINTAYGLQQKAKGREDKRLAALEYIEAGRELNTAAANIQDYAGYTAKSVLEKGTALTELGTNQVASAQALRGQSIVPGYTSPTTNQVANYREAVGKKNISQGQAELADLDNNQSGYKAKKRAKADSLANIKVSIGSSSSRSETAYEAHTYNGGSIASEGIITLASNSTDDIKGNMKAIGQSITGRDVNLIASHDVSLEAGENSSKQREHYTSKGWSLGANIGVNGSGIIGANAGFNKAKQTGNTDVTTHTGTTVTATNTAAITSGNDTTFIGSKAIGEQVTANVGGNLSIISVQDEKTYTETSSNKGLSISTTGGSIGNVSFANHKGSMNSTYKSVTEQAGLYAGDKGFSIDTKGTASLVGAVIHSDAEANKNTLTTGSLTTESIHNTAEYTSRNTGVSYTYRGDFKHLSQAGKDAVWNTLGLLPVLQPDATDSAQSTTNSAISSGTIKVTDNSANLDQLSRDTANNLNKLDEIFDKKKVEERQELSQLFAKEAFAQLHDWNPTSPEGKAAKAIAHGIVAETSARMAGNKAGSGFYAGATNEALIGEIQKIAKDNPAVAQWLSASIGAVVNAGMGNSAVTGAAVAQYGTKWNASGEIKSFEEAGEAFNLIIPGELTSSGKNELYLRTRYGDIYQNRPLEPGEIAVVQFVDVGKQRYGQEVQVNADHSWSNVEAPLGLVIPGVPSRSDYAIKPDYSNWSIREPQEGSYSVQKLDGTSAYLVGRINNWDVSGPSLSGGLGKGNLSLGKVEGNLIDVGLRFDHKDRILEQVDGHLLGVKGEIGLSYDNNGFSAGAGAMGYLASGTVKTASFDTGIIKETLEAEGYYGAVGAGGKVQIDKNKGKLKLGTELAWGAGGALNVTVEKSDEDSENREKN